MKSEEHRASLLVRAQRHAALGDPCRLAIVDLRAERPKLLTDEMAAQAHRVITMGCAVDAAACPAVFLKDIEDWGLPDPTGQPLDEVRSIRDVIGGKVAALLSELAAQGPSPPE